MPFLATRTLTALPLPPLLQNEAQAITWLERAAKKDHVPSLALLGALLTFYVPARAAEGAEMLRTAANAGDVAYAARRTLCALPHAVCFHFLVHRLASPTHALTARA